MILGLLHKTSGRLSVFGKPPSDVSRSRSTSASCRKSRTCIAISIRGDAGLLRQAVRLDRKTRRRRTEELLDMIGLAQVAHRPIGEFSKGMTRRIGIAQALINDPEFLILDEPTSGLDPIGTRQVKDLIIDLKRRGKTILLSSHLLADVEDVCDRMVMLYGGKIRAQGTVDELLSDTQRTVIETPRLSEQRSRASSGCSKSPKGWPSTRFTHRGSGWRSCSCRWWSRPGERRSPPPARLTAAEPPRSCAAKMRRSADGETLIDSLVTDQEDQRARPVAADACRASGQAERNRARKCLMNSCATSRSRGRHARWMMLMRPVRSPKPTLTSPSSARCSGRMRKKRTMRKARD
jgi:ABC-type multidrug transport system ATPase subunit